MPYWLGVAGWVLGLMAALYAVLARAEIDHLEDELARTGGELDAAQERLLTAGRAKEWAAPAPAEPDPWPAVRIAPVESPPVKHEVWDDVEAVLDPNPQPVRSTP